MLLHIVTLDFIGEVIHVLLQLLEHAIRIERSLHHLKVLGVFQIHSILLDVEFVIALVMKGQKNSKHRLGAVRDLFQFLPVHGQSNLKVA